MARVAQAGGDPVTLTPASLCRICRAAGGRRLTVVTGPDAARWAAWPYGCVQLHDGLLRTLGGPVDGSYELRGDTLTPAECESFGPELVRREMLPVLAATNRTRLVPLRWMYEDGKHIRRVLERSDRAHAAVAEVLWRAWSWVNDLPTWQVGARGGMVVWAAEGAAAVAGLLPIHPRVAPSAPPEVAA